MNLDASDGPLGLAELAYSRITPVLKVSLQRFLKRKVDLYCNAGAMITSEAASG
jgi:hypothetical protein